MFADNFPPDIELSINKYATEHGLSVDEAVLQLLVSGLNMQPNQLVPDQPSEKLEDIFELFSSDDAAKTLDEVVRLAYEGRTHSTRDVAS